MNGVVKKYSLPKEQERVLSFISKKVSLLKNTGQSLKVMVKLVMANKFSFS
jgi:hypothetical protein